MRLLLHASALVLPALLAGSCQTSGSETFPHAAPRSVDLDPDRLAEAVAVVRELVERGDPVGVELLIVKRNRTVLHEVFGWRDRERELPVEKGTLCRIRSMTKPIVASAVWMLVEEGKLDPATPVASYLDAFDNARSRAITVDQLLTHTAGFSHPGFPALLQSYASLREAVDATGAIGPAVAPGSRYLYSDADSATLAALVAEASGEPAEDFIARRVLAPLGMESSFCNFELSDPRAGRVSATYVLERERMVKYWDPTQAQELAFFRGSGGVYSTPEDYARFLSTWKARGRVGGARWLAESSVIAGLTSEPLSLQPGAPDHYARHWQIFGAAITPEEMRGGALPSFGHGGSDGTFAIVVPETDTLVLYFTQSRGSRSFERAINALIQAVE